jgi:hypothetical protein
MNRSAICNLRHNELLFVIIRVAGARLGRQPPRWGHGWFDCRRARLHGSAVAQTNLFSNRRAASGGGLRPVLAAAARGSGKKRPLRSNQETYARADRRTDRGDARSETSGDDGECFRSRATLDDLLSDEVMAPVLLSAGYEPYEFREMMTEMAWNLATP